MGILVGFSGVLCDLKGCLSGSAMEFLVICLRRVEGATREKIVCSHVQFLKIYLISPNPSRIGVASGAGHSTPKKGIPVSSKWYAKVSQYSRAKKLYPFLFFHRAFSYKEAKGQLLTVTEHSLMD